MSRRIVAGLLLMGWGACVALRPQPASAGEMALKVKERPLSVWLQVDGKKRQITTTPKTIRAMLEEAGMTLSPLDRIYPGKDRPLASNMTVSITRVSTRTVERIVKLPPKTVYQFSKDLRTGIQRVVQEGREGSAVQVVRVWTKNGKITEQEVIGTRVQQKPVDRTVMMGERSLTVSRGGMRPRKVLSLEATGYSPDLRSCGRHATGYTSIGLRAGYGIVAVDPRVIPLGTRLFIEGYGYAVAADVGRAIKGLRIDLGHDTHSRALQVGRRRVKVYILD